MPPPSPHPLPTRALSRRVTPAPGSTARLPGAFPRIPGEGPDLRPFPSAPGSRRLATEGPAHSASWSPA